MKENGSITNKLIKIENRLNDTSFSKEERAILNDITKIFHKFLLLPNLNKEKIDKFTSAIHNLQDSLK